MYGYVVVNQPELKFREYDVYRSYYCGVCHSLGERYGNLGKFSLSYDATFLTMLLTGLYEPEVICTERKCIIHPFNKHLERQSNITDYVADMNVLMTYYKCRDDWEDEKKLTGKVYSDCLKKKVKKIELAYPYKAQLIKEQLEELAELEKQNESNVDKVANTFGNILACIFAMKNDEWQQDLQSMGFYLGKFIYIIDAYDDLEKDMKAGHYNVFTHYCEMPDYQEFVETVLNSVMAECARHFERLPIVNDVQILRNIIYSGVWSKFDQKGNKPQATKNQQNDSK